MSSDSKLKKSEEQWRRCLSAQQFHVLREGGTEPAFSGRYHDCKTPGVYVCAGCGQALFDAASKYDSGSGWPSYRRAIDEEAVATREDHRHGMQRVEVHCRQCGGHLGHVFADGPPPTGLRYCINSASLLLKKET